ncbi:hypothetical protein C0Q70_07432 [Pomacea canaliculata]|uniref:Uncharacterized protein n=1 Tax=Pomacea canaliculata TaxID=400727 RepID=A0A2T7PF06_POMCA|nr:hypothetical protein C0Q70_07432 [Pomacea canaliculata]
MNLCGEISQHVEGRLTVANRFGPHLVHSDPRADSNDEMRAGDAAADEKNIVVERHTSPWCTWPVRLERGLLCDAVKCRAVMSTPATCYVKLRERSVRSSDALLMLIAASNRSCPWLQPSVS